MNRRLPPGPPKAGGADQKLEELELRLGVHDVSRIEWTCAVKLPEVPSQIQHYEIEFTVEIPSNLYQQQNVWDNLQTFTRLQSPTEQGQIQVERSDIDELRRDTLGIAHRLKQLRDRFERASIAASTALIDALHPALAGNLQEVIDTAVLVVREMRACLVAPLGGGEQPSADVQRECELADEFLSHQLLDFLAGAQKAVDDVLLGEQSRLRELNPSWTEQIREQLALALERELAHRESSRFANPHADSPTELSRFVERGSTLKKHFQDVLFLDAEAYMVDYRLRNWTGVVAASLAAAFWLSFTLFFPIGAGTKASISLFAAFVIFALAYALKDRVKELTRGWLAGRLTRLYGQRALKLRLPARLDAHRPVLVEASETFDAVAQLSEDALNRRVGRTRRVTVLGYRMRAELSGSGALERAGIDSIKHIFRYDLTALFSRLDDAVKSVPVLDQATHRVRFADAPKEYRFPVRIAAQLLNGGAPRRIEQQSVLVLSKRGIGRIEAIAQ